MREMWVCSLGQKDPLVWEMANYTSILAWKISQTEEPDGIQAGSHKELDTTGD